MKECPFHRVLIALTVLVVTTLACGAIAAPDPTATLPPPTETATLVPPTSTPKPTSTPRPTATPDLAATEQFIDWQKELQDFVDSGKLDSTIGDVKEYDDFTERWAQIGWYKWWPFEEMDGDFMFGAHFDWTSASPTPEVSGCGLVFGVQPNDDHYAVVLDKSRILFMMARGSHVYQVGKTSGSGRVNIGNPAEADFQVLVRGQMAYVSVDGEITTYTLSADQSTSGTIAATVLSGTNRDYGTSCEMTNVHIWTPSD